MLTLLGGVASNSGLHPGEGQGETHNGGLSQTGQVGMPDHVLRFDLGVLQGLVNPVDRSRGYPRFFQELQ